MKSFLPIIVPGNNPADTRTIQVPCALPDSFDFRVFLPSRGVRTFTCWLTSMDPIKAEVKDVQFANREGDPRAGLSYEVDADEQQRADDAASSVLDGVLKALGVNTIDRTPFVFPGSLGKHARTLEAIAKAFMAECAAFDALTTAYAKMPDSVSAIYLKDPSTERTLSGWVSQAAEMLSNYVEVVVDSAVLAQSEKADKQLAEHPTHDDEDDAGSERIRAPRSLDVATLKCLDVEY